MHSVFLDCTFYLILFSLRSRPCQAIHGFLGKIYITVNRNPRYGLQLRRCNYESIRHRNSSLPVSYADDWGLGATLAWFGGFSSGGPKLAKGPAHRHLLCHNCRGLFHHRHGRPGISERPSGGLVDALRHHRNANPVTFFCEEDPI